MNSPEFSAYASEGVFAPLYNQAREVAWDTEQQEALVGFALRAVATARHNARQQPGFNVATWRPSPEDVSTLRPITRQLAMIRNANTFLADCEAERTELGLIDYQVPAFYDFIDALNTFTPDHQRKNEDANRILTKGIYAQLSCNWGKSVLFAKMGLALGIGKSPETEPGRPLKGALLVPQAHLAEQLKGKPVTESELEDIDIEQLAKGLAAHAPSLRSAIWRRGKHPDCDLVIMTYSYFRSLMQHKRLNPKHFDALFLDEAHEALGSQISQAIEDFRPGKLCVGLTATAENSYRHVGDILPHGFHFTDDLELIENGVHNGLQYFALSTGQQIATLTKGYDFTSEEFTELRQNQTRNRQILDLAQELVRMGRSGLIPCLPGEDSKHARDIADSLNQIEIPAPTPEDPAATRYITAIAVGRFRSPAQNEKIIEDWELGRYDILTSTDMLTQGLDSKRVGFMILARPTASPRVGIQRLGRAYRKNPWEVTIVVEMVDDVVSYGNAPIKQQYTVFHALGLEDYAPGMLIASPNIKERAARGQRVTGNRPAKKILEKTVSLEDPSDELPSLLYPEQLPGMFEGLLTTEDTPLISQLYLEKRQKVEPPPPGWVPLNSVLGQLFKKGIGIRTCRNILAQNAGEFEPGETEIALYKPSESRARSMNYISPAAAAFLLEYEIGETAPLDYHTLLQAAKRSGVSPHVFSSVVRSINEEQTAQDLPQIVPTTYRTRKQHRLAPHFSDDDIEIVKAKVAAYPKPTTEEISISNIAKTCGVGNGAIENYLSGEEITVTKKHDPQTLKPVRYVHEDHIPQIYNHFVESDIPEGTRPLAMISADVGLHTAFVRLAITDYLGLPETVIQYGRTQHEDAAGSYRKYYVSDELAQQVTDLLRGAVALTTYAKQRKISRVTVSNDAKELPQVKILRNKQVSLLTREAQAALDNHYGIKGNTKGTARAAKKQPLRHTGQTPRRQETAPAPSPSEGVPALRPVPKNTPRDVPPPIPKQETPPAPARPTLPIGSPPAAIHRPRPQAEPPLAVYGRWDDLSELLRRTRSTAPAMEQLLRQVPVRGRLRKAADGQHIEVHPSLYAEVDNVCRRLPRPPLGWITMATAREVVKRHQKDPEIILPQLKDHGQVYRHINQREEASIDIYYDVRTLQRLLS